MEVGFGKTDGTTGNVTEYFTGFLVSTADVMGLRDVF